MKYLWLFLLTACSSYPTLDVPPPPDASTTSRTCQHWQTILIPTFRGMFPIFLCDQWEPETCAECRQRCAELDASTAKPIILCSFNCDFICEAP